MSSERFEKLKALVMADFNEYEIDSEPFESKSFNTE